MTETGLSIPMSVQVSKAKEFVGGYVDVFNNENYMSLRTVIKNIGATDTKKTIYGLMFSHLVDSETGKTFLDVEQENVRQLIDNIMENYPDVSLEDVTLFCKKLVRGEFIGKEIGVEYDQKGRKIGGKMINVFKYDVPTLCLMFQRYYAERVVTYEDMKMKESNEHKLGATLPPEILKMFEESESFKGIYNSLENYCEREEIDISVFTDSYTKLFNEYVDNVNLECTKTNVNELTDEEFDKVIATIIPWEDFVKSRSAQFLVIQNQIIGTPEKINNSYVLLKITKFAQDYDIQALIDICKELGMWMIPTKYYYAAKKIVFEGGEIKYRYNLDEKMVLILGGFVKKLIEDRAVPRLNTLFIVAMIFNFTLHIGRFNKYNGG